MQTATGVTVIEHGQLVDGTGSTAIRDAALVIENGLITFVGPAAAMPVVPPNATRIDAHGGTIMPGLIEAHFHATYFDVEALEDLDIKYPVEYVTLLAGCNAKLALECGYTSARSGGSLFNVDVWLKKAIESGSRVFFIQKHCTLGCSKMNSMPSLAPMRSRCIRPVARCCGIEAQPTRAAAAMSASKGRRVLSAILIIRISWQG